jgi:hypothetical protein
MPPTSTFFRRLRLAWVAVNVAIVVVAASGDRDLSALTAMLSFPAGVVVVLMLPPTLDGLTGGRAWLNDVLFGTAIFISGYVQWFVIGRAIAGRILARFPSRRLLDVGRVAVAVVLLGLTFLGLAFVHAIEQSNHYVDRARTVREGMTVAEVRTILGDPKFDELATTENAGLCPAGTARVTWYWDEHEWLTRRSLLVCSDRQETVIHVSLGVVN